ncbi:MAG TPA: FAD-binding and (Fe-S)-binding domain-containing protein [Bacteroidales bacterium]|nr:FAD-binding and (Fe-S)-binding domain-containing protein [Bacteroidales bacterium]
MSIINVKLLEKELRQRTQSEIHFDDGSKALYATDGSNYRMAPIGVVLPKTEKDIIEIIAVCSKYGLPVLSRGGGTSLAGQCCNEAIVLDMSKYFNRVLAIDEANKMVTVETGIVLDHMKKATEEKQLTFGPDPATHDHCTIGGMLGNNSCGVHSVMAANYGYGARMSDNTHALKILTYDGAIMEVGPTTERELDHIIAQGGAKGEIYRKLKHLRDKHEKVIRNNFPHIPRRVSGFNLDELLPEKGFNVARALVGTEGTCVTILEAKLKLMPSPKARTLVVLGYPDVYHAGAHIPEILKFKPIGLEGLDDLLINFMHKKGMHPSELSMLPKGNGWLLVEFGGNSKEEADKAAHLLMDKLKKDKDHPSMELFDDPKQEKLLWEVRESGLGATAFIPGEPDAWPGWEDSAVSPEHVGEYLKDLKSLFRKHGYKASLYGHFGQGCIHCRINFDLITAEGLRNYKQFTIEATDLVKKYKGSISGEHGDGQARGDLLERLYGPELVEAFREFKSIWDPQWKMNPGKVINSYGQLNNLRLGTNYNVSDDEMRFQFPADKHSFAHATVRCVGVGKCRRTEGGTMCPSYMVTHEEKHSTRGRTHLLFEMFRGDIIKDRWNNKYIKESLDLCLACKGCKGDCPVNVDVATYKSEFLSHYYKHKLRPRSAYAFGLIYWWSRMASLAPGVANFLTHTTGLAGIAKFIAQVAPQREIPRFAKRTFKQWLKSNPPKTIGRQKVILWADTFNNHFVPDTLRDALKVLEDTGCQVIVPMQSLCCGRPLFDFGMIDLAKKLLLKILDTLRDEIRAGTPVVGLEPSCVSVFRDELCNLFPNNKDALRLKQQTYTLAEFLLKYVPDYQFQPLTQKALVHGHCHHKAVMKLNAEEKILQKVGLDFEILNSGCCGMAGYFGYKKGEPYEIGLKAGEMVLLPAVRSAEKDTLIIADGFSCREQIEQETKRKGLHLAQILAMALNKNNHS